MKPLGLMSCQLWSEMILVCFSVKARFATIFITCICECAFCLCKSVSAGSTAHHFMNPRSALDCRFWQFSAEAPCSPPLFDPAPAFLLHSFYPTVDGDIAVGCLSSLWLWSALMDIPGLEDTQMVDGLMLYIQSLHGTCWSCFCCRQVVPSGNHSSPCLSDSGSSFGNYVG